MTAALVTLAVAVLAAAGTAVALALALVRAERGASRLELLAGQGRARADELAADLERVRAGAVTDLARSSQLIADLKRRLVEAQERAIANNVPGAVRDDLRGLLGAIEEAGAARTLAAGDLLPLRAPADPTPTPAERPGGPR